MSPRLDPEERKTLLSLARASIQDKLLSDDTLAGVLRTADLTPPLREPRGAFVTLREAPAADPRQPGKLRGCIGTVVADEPLYRNVIRNAAHAAFDDPRFPAVRGAELSSLRVEISALTPLRPVDSADDIVPGRDGVHLEHGPNRAVFLPQVAVEQGWGTRQLLEHLAMKADLEPDAWKRGRLRVFQAEVFGERERSDHTSSS